MASTSRLVSGFRVFLIVQAIVALALALSPRVEPVINLGHAAPDMFMAGVIKVFFKLNHTIAFFTMTLTACLAYFSYRLRLAVALMIFGLLIEALQTLTPDRNAQWQDVFANGLGIGLGLAVGTWLMRWRGRRWGLV